ncbi:hypothetical protein BAYG_02211 [Brucella abortus bv. 5 str. B3196]|nr:hypothetical protein BAYG_02211 [Brucella abortus bv. 5 str. B3196]
MISMRRASSAFMPITTPTRINGMQASPTLASYRDEWLRQAAESAAIEYAEPLAEGIFRATDLSVIDITGDVALARKKFDGTIARKDGTQDRLNWQTLYFCRRDGNFWKITGFVGYMAYR